MKAILDISARRRALESLLLFAPHIAMPTAPSRRLAATLLAVAAFSWMGPSFASVYRCAGADGSATYSDVPCGSNTEKIDVQTAPSAVSSNPPRNDNSAQRTNLEARTRSQRQAGVVQCETAKFNAWIRLQTPRPDKETRLAKFKSVQDDCRQSFHFTEEDVAAYQTPANSDARSVTSRAVITPGSDHAIGGSETHQIASTTDSDSGKLPSDNASGPVNALAGPESELQKARGSIVVQCTNDQYKEWLKSQGSHPDITVGIAKMRSANQDCLAHIPDSATLTLGADGVPTTRTGNWSVAVRDSGAKKNQKHFTMCMGAQTSKSLTATSKQLAEAFGCSGQHKVHGNQVTTEADCKLGDSKLQNHSVETFFGDVAYHEETTTTFEPPLNGIASSTSVTDAYWIGSCPEGMNPGDVIVDSGAKLNIEDTLSPPGTLRVPDKSPGNTPAATVSTQVNLPPAAENRSYYRVMVTIVSKNDWKKTYGLNSFIQQHKLAWFEKGKTYAWTDWDKNEWSFVKLFPRIYYDNREYMNYVPRTVSDFVPDSHGGALIWLSANTGDTPVWLNEPTSDNQTAWLTYKDSRIEIPIPQARRDRFFFDSELEAIIRFDVDHSSLKAIQDKCAELGKQARERPDGWSCAS